MDADRGTGNLSTTLVLVLISFDIILANIQSRQIKDRYDFFPFTPNCEETVTKDGINLRSLRSFVTFSTLSVPTNCSLQKVIPNLPLTPLRTIVIGNI